MTATDRVLSRMSSIFLGLRAQRTCGVHHSTSRKRNACRTRCGGAFPNCDTDIVSVARRAMSWIEALERLRVASARQLPSCNRERLLVAYQHQACRRRHVWLCE